MSHPLRSWIRRLQRWFANPVKRVPIRRPLPRTYLALDVLEDRVVPTTFNVNTLADLSIAAGVNVMNGTINGTNLVTLRSAIDAANQTPGGNTIRLMMPGTYSIALPGANTGTDATGAFAILPGGGNLTILNASNGAITVNGNHLDRVFDINPTFDPANPTPKFLVTLQGFTITGGNASPGDGPGGSGGGIRDQGNASLTLTNMVVTNNTATADGGGVSMENTVSVPWTLTVNASTITNNHAGDAGGGLETDGSGKVFINAGTVITGNTCVNQGAGIWLDAINVGSGVSSVTVTPNSFMEPEQPTVAFTSVDGNGSGAAGTAILNGNGTIVGVNITNPGSGYDAPPTVAFSLMGSPLLVSATATIAPLPMQSATLNVTGATITNNQALTGPGGGIGNAGASTVTISHSTISNNLSGNVGGGFGDQNNQGNLIVTNSLFLNNIASAAGGGIYEGGPDTSITNTQISGNQSGDAGGGLFVAGTTLFMQNCTISNNTAAGDAGTSAGGGGIELQTTGAGLNASTITNTTITNNRAVNNTGINVVGNIGADGGGIDALYLAGDLALQNDTINANYAEEGGGIIWGGNNSTVSVQNTIIAGDFAQAFPEALTLNFGFTDLGGNVLGILSTGFTANTTQGGTTANLLSPLLAPLGNNGGPMIGAAGSTQVLQTEALETGSPAIGKGVLLRAPGFDARGMVAEVNGLIDVGAVNAVVPVPMTTTTANMKSPLISQKMVNGVLTTTYNVNSTLDTHTPAAGTLTLRDAIDLANQAQGNKIIQLDVAGDYKITLPGANTGTNASGAFAILPSGGNVTIMNCSGGTATVDGNHLDRVFDINPGDDTNFNDEFTVTLQGITITNGIAQDGDGQAGSGGGIRDQGIASLTLNNVVVTNNIATADGGGLSMENTVSSHWVLTINNCVISDNHAGDAGGGVETDGSSKVFINSGTVITGNTCVNQGAGIWLDAIPVNDPNGTVASVTITNPGDATFGPLLGFPTVVFTSQDGHGSGAAGVINVDANGAPTGVTITNPGSGYDMPPLISFTFSFFTPNIVATAALTQIFQGASLNVTGAIITNNAALDMLGGGIGNSGNGAVTIQNCSILNNFTGGTGGGFADSNNVGTLTVINSVIDNNFAVAGGGGIQEGGPSTTIISSLIDGNLSGGPGGGLFANGTTLTIQNSTFANNLASGDGNGLGGGGIELQTTGATTIANTTLTGNRAINNNGANGGAIDATNLPGAVALVNDTINANFASNGGGIFWGGTTGSTFSLQNTIVAQNLLANGGVGVDLDNLTGKFTDLGGNVIGVAGDANTGLGAANGGSPLTQVGTLLHPLNPLLDPLGNFGGPLIGAAGDSLTLLTEALHAGSPAFGKGVKSGAPTADARGNKSNSPTSAGAVNSEF